MEFNDFKISAESSDSQTLDTLKDNFRLLKDRLLLSDALIQRYNDKVVEYDYMKKELTSTKEELAKATKNYESYMSKAVTFQVENNELKKANSILDTKVKDMQTKMNADQRHIQQLTYKIDVMEQKHNEEKMELELRFAGMSEEKKPGKQKSTKRKNFIQEEHINKNIISTSTQTDDIVEHVLSSTKENPTVNYTAENGCLAKHNVISLDEILPASPVAQNDVTKSTAISVDKVLPTSPLIHNNSEDLANSLKEVNSMSCTERNDNVTESISQKHAEFVSSHVQTEEVVLHDASVQTPKSKFTDKCIMTEAVKVLCDLRCERCNFEIRPELCECCASITMSKSVKNISSVIDHDLTTFENEIREIHMFQQGLDKIEESTTDELVTSSPVVKELQKKIEMLERKVKKVQKTKKEINMHNCCNHQLSNFHPSNFLSNTFNSSAMSEFLQRIFQLGTLERTQVNVERKKAKKRKLLTSPLKVKPAKKLKTSLSSNNWVVDVSTIENVKETQPTIVQKKRGRKKKNVEKENCKSSLQHSGNESDVLNVTVNTTLKEPEVENENIFNLPTDVTFNKSGWVAQKRTYKRKVPFEKYTSAKSTKSSTLFNNKKCANELENIIAEDNSQGSNKIHTDVETQKSLDKQICPPDNQTEDESYVARRENNAISADIRLNSFQSSHTFDAEMLIEQSQEIMYQSNIMSSTRLESPKFLDEKNEQQSQVVKEQSNILSSKFKSNLQSSRSPDEQICLPSEETIVEKSLDVTNQTNVMNSELESDFESPRSPDEQTCLPARETLVEQSTEVTNQTNTLNPDMESDLESPTSSNEQICSHTAETLVEQSPGVTNQTNVMNSDVESDLESPRSPDEQICLPAAETLVEQSPGVTNQTNKINSNVNSDLESPTSPDEQICSHAAETLVEQSPGVTNQTNVMNSDVESDLESPRSPDEQICLPDEEKSVKQGDNKETIKQSNAINSTLQLNFELPKLSNERVRSLHKEVSTEQLQKEMSSKSQLDFESPRSLNEHVCLLQREALSEQLQKTKYNKATKSSKLELNLDSQGTPEQVSSLQSKVSEGQPKETMKLNQKICSKLQLNLESSSVSSERVCLRHREALAEQSQKTVKHNEIVNSKLKLNLDSQKTPDKPMCREEVKKSKISDIRESSQSPDEQTKRTEIVDNFKAPRPFEEVHSAIKGINLEVTSIQIDHCYSNKVAFRPTKSLITDKSVKCNESASLGKRIHVPTKTLISNSESSENNVEDETKTSNSASKLSDLPPIHKEVKKMEMTAHQKVILSKLKKLKNSNKANAKKIEINEPVSREIEKPAILSDSEDYISAKKQRVAHVPKLSEKKSETSEDITTPIRHNKIIPVENLLCRRSVATVKQKKILVSSQKLELSKEQTNPEILSTIMKDIENSCKEVPVNLRNWVKSQTSTPPTKVTQNNEKQTVLAVQNNASDESVILTTKIQNNTEPDIPKIDTTDENPTDSEKHERKEVVYEEVSHEFAIANEEGESEFMSSESKSGVKSRNARRGRPAKKVKKTHKSIKLLISKIQFPLSLPKEEAGSSILWLLSEYFSEKSIMARAAKKKFSLDNKTTNIVHTELERLMKDEQWTSKVHNEVIEKITESCTSYMAANAIVEFLIKSCEKDEPVDKTYTPPAPLMTKTQQKLVTLIRSLEKRYLNIFEDVQSAIEHKLFKLKNAPELKQVEAMSCMFAVLSRIKKDRERVRIFCVDALYCFHLKAVVILYTVLKNWPEVLPMYETARAADEKLPLCLMYIIMSMRDPSERYPKIKALKQLLTHYYKYSHEHLHSQQLATECLKAFAEEHNKYTSMNTVLLLLCKKEGPEWAYKHIIMGGLIQMILNKTHKCLYDAFDLLGSILRSFPLSDESGKVKDFTEQLCDVLNSGEGSADQQESTARALVCLSRHYFDQVVASLLKWKPVRQILPETRQRIEVLFNSRDHNWWRKFIACDYSMPKKTDSVSKKE